MVLIKILYIKYIVLAIDPFLGPPEATRPGAHPGPRNKVGPENKVGPGNKVAPENKVGTMNRVGPENAVGPPINVYAYM